MIETSLNADALKELKKWFVRYVGTFDSDDPAWRENMTLKKVHTFRVCREAKDIARDIGLPELEIRLADTVALLHDIGRFKQYAQHRTFVDRYSINHAELGVSVLCEKGILEGFEESIRDLILRVISYHNRAHLPDGETERCLLHTKILRDADKLDVLRVATSYYLQKEPKSNIAIQMDFPDTPGISDGVYEDLMQGRIIDLAHIGNLNDFKLLQLGWVYDINFRLTYQRIRDRGFLDKIRKALPESERIDKVFEAAWERVEKGIAANVGGIALQ